MTKLPWTKDKYGNVNITLTGFGLNSGHFNQEAQDNTDYVLKSANLFPELVEALESARESIAGYPRSLGYNITDLPKIDELLKKAKL